MLCVYRISDGAKTETYLYISGEFFEIVVVNRLIVYEFSTFNNQ